MSLETVLDWLHRSSYAIKDGKPLSLKQYLTEIKEAIVAEKNIKEIEEQIKHLSPEAKDKRDKVLREEKEGVGQLIW